MRRIALWGQHVDEYQDMFGLSDSDLNKKFFEYNSGASAFNFELKNKALSCVSCDPWFDLDKDALEIKINENFNERLEQLEKNLKRLSLERYKTFDNLIKYRREGLELFFADYNAGKKENRYISVKDGKLPFKDFEFDFVLVANSLFSDSSQHSVEFHINIIKELARVAKDVRIFPLVDTKGEPSPLLGPVLLKLYQDNYGVEVLDVSYNLQPKGNAMMRICAKQCHVI
jgi:hypothetical protein